MLDIIFVYLVNPVKEVMAELLPINTQQSAVLKQMQSLQKLLSFWVMKTDSECLMITCVGYLHATTTIISKNSVKNSCH